MNSLQPGESISQVEVTNISVHGIWLYSHGREMFLSYESFPWFKDQTIKVVLNVEEQGKGHYYWPDIDVDLSDEIIQYPERFPLKAGKPRE